MGRRAQPLRTTWSTTWSIQYHALQGAQTYAKYLQDAEGQPDVQELLREVIEQDGRRAEQCHALLHGLTKDHGIG